MFISNLIGENVESEPSDSNFLQALRLMHAIAKSVYFYQKKTSKKSCPFSFIFCIPMQVFWFALDFLVFWYESRFIDDLFHTSFYNLTQYIMALDD